MRGSTLATLLAVLPACTIDNPGFGLGSNGVDSGTTAASGSDTMRPIGTSTTEPGETTGSSSTTASTTASTTGLGTTDTNATSLPVCTPSIDAALDPHFYINGVLYTDCQNQTTKSVIGKLEANGGAISMETNVNCAPGDEGTTITLGAGYPLPDKFIGCANATVTWDKANGDCAIGLLEVRDSVTDKIYYLGAFNNYPDMGSLPLKVSPMQSTNCGCLDDIPGCCAPLDAGDLMLMPAGNGPIFPQQHGPAAIDDTNLFELYNIESYVDSVCDWHIDWVAASVP